MLVVHPRFRFGESSAQKTPFPSTLIVVDGHCMTRQCNPSGMVSGARACALISVDATISFGRSGREGREGELIRSRAMSLLAMRTTTSSSVGGGGVTLRAFVRDWQASVRDEQMVHDIAHGVQRRARLPSSVALLCEHELLQIFEPPIGRLSDTPPPRRAQVQQATVLVQVEWRHLPDRCNLAPQPCEAG